MLHSNRQTTFIGRQKVVYKTLPIGNLGIRVEGMFPLQQGFYGDVLACISVGVHQDSALGSEQGIVSTVMSLPNSTAVGAVFGRMPTVHNIQRNVVVETTRGKNLPELEERDSHHRLVELPALSFESFEVLNGDVSIEPDGEVHNLPDHLAEVGLDEILFSCTQSLQESIGTEGLQSGTPFHYLLSFGVVSRIDSKFHEVEGLGGEGLAVSGGVEFGRQASDFIAFLSLSIPYEGSHDLNVKTSPVFGGMADLMTEITDSSASLTFGEHGIELGNGRFVEIDKDGFLSGRWFNLQKDSTFHSLNDIYLQGIYSLCCSTIHPTTKAYELPCRV